MQPLFDKEIRHILGQALSIAFVLTAWIVTGIILFTKRGDQRILFYWFVIPLGLLLLYLLH